MDTFAQSRPTTTCSFCGRGILRLISPGPWQGAPARAATLLCPFWQMLSCHPSAGKSYCGEDAAAYLAVICGLHSTSFHWRGLCQPLCNSFSGICHHYSLTSYKRKKSWESCADCTSKDQKSLIPKTRWCVQNSFELPHQQDCCISQFSCLKISFGT